MKSNAPRLLSALLATALASGAPLLAGDVQVDGSFVSTVPTGTPPLDVSSTTRVDDLNADLLDGLDSSDLFTAATDGSGSGLDADLLDGLDASAFARSLGNVVRVGKTGGDFTSIQAALDSITTASASNPFLVLVGPGVYDERVVMESFVNIQGSGEGVTKITQSGGTSSERGTVAGADDAELRFLTVENSGGSDFVYGLFNEDVSPRLVHVTVEVDGTASNVFGILNIASSGIPSTPELVHVTVDVEGPGTSTVRGVLNNLEANARIRHSRVSVTGSGGGAKFGIFNIGADPVIRDVEVFVESTETTANVKGVVNADTSGAIVRSLRVQVSGGGFRTGVDNSSGTLTLRDLEVSVAGDGSTSYGVFNEDATVVLESCSITAQGGSSSTAGVFNSDASGELRDCTVKATGGTGFRSAVQGFDSTGGGAFTYDVQQSRLEGADFAISSPATYTIQVGASQLHGGLTGSASYTCAQSYDGAFVELTPGCAPDFP